MKIDKFTEQQRELFDQFPDAEEKRKPLRMLGRRKDRLSFSISFDTLLLCGILLLMVAVLIYSTGVEIGRHHQRMIPISLPVMKPVAKPTPPVSTPISPLKSAAAFPPKETKAPAAQPTVATGTVYTIQVLSFRQSAPAEKALETLRKKGHLAFPLTSSRGVALCVGNFKKSSEAQPMLKELKRFYPDSFIRKK